MTCVENIKKFIVPNDVIRSLCDIYKYIGKNDFYKEVVKDDVKVYSQTVNLDTYFLSRLIELDITDARLRLIITKNSEPRNREEKVLSSIKDLIFTFQNNPFEQKVSSSDLLNVINYIYPNQNIKYDVIKEERKNIYHSINIGSKRELIDSLNSSLMSLENGSVENLILTANYIVDLYANKPFTDHNDTLVYIMLYLFLLKSNIDSLKYVSLFQYIFENKKDFDDKLSEACYNYNEGFPQILPFIRFLTNLVLDLYESCDKNIKLYKQEQELNKGNTIETTIMNQSSMFTKDDIRSYHPYVSESTINRALIKLRDEGMIKPIGKGRSAKWMRIGLK